jgi:hypothetical protein
MNARTVTPLEQVLTRFWDETLGREDSDRLTNFFGAGGREADAERLLLLVEETFHVAMPLAALQEAPTVRAFAELLKHQVDHPGRLERLAERLLNNAVGHSATASKRTGHRTGASW